MSGGSQPHPPPLCLRVTIVGIIRPTGEREEHGWSVGSGNKYPRYSAASCLSSDWLTVVQRWAELGSQSGSGIGLHPCPEMNRDPFVLPWPDVQEPVQIPGLVPCILEEKKLLLCSQGWDPGTSLRVACVYTGSVSSPGLAHPVWAQLMGGLALGTCCPASLFNII